MIDYVYEVLTFIASLIVIWNRLPANDQDKSSDDQEQGQTRCRRKHKKKDSDDETGSL